VKALELDETLPAAHVSLGRVQLFYDWDWPAAEKEFRRSLELNPNLPEAHLGFARYLAAEGRFDESIEHVRTAYALDPLSISARFDGIDDFYLSRRYQVTLDECRKVKELPPDFREPFDVESFVYARTGRFQEAANAAQMAVVHRQGPIDLSWAAAAYAESEESKRRASSCDSFWQRHKTDSSAGTTWLLCTPRGEKLTRLFRGWRRVSNSVPFEWSMSGWIPDSMRCEGTHDLQKSSAESAYLSG
jgi:tetratricopeptide (TPR) repeat protein